MKNSFKGAIAKATNDNVELNKKILQAKRSWDEVEKLLQASGKTKRK